MWQLWIYGDGKNKKNTSNSVVRCRIDDLFVHVHDRSIHCCLTNLWIDRDALNTMKVSVCHSLRSIWHHQFIDVYSSYFFVRLIHCNKSTLYRTDAATDNNGQCRETIEKSLETIKKPESRKSNSTRLDSTHVWKILTRLGFGLWLGNGKPIWSVNWSIEVACPTAEILAKTGEKMSKF